MSVEYPLISVVIPTTGEVNASRRVGLTVSSLMVGHLQPDEIIIVKDKERRGACWARNEGAQRAKGKYLLFSDDDVVWTADGVKALCAALENDSRASFAYGWWTKDGVSQPYSRQPYDAGKILKINYISTMSLVRKSDFPGFDPAIPRLQDWDLWVTLVKQGKYGIYCDTKIFSTKEDRNGITRGKVSYDEAFGIVKKKHAI